MKYSDLEEPTDILDKCLTWGHIAPTAPDSLGKMKFYLIDMYIQCMYIVYLWRLHSLTTALKISLQASISSGPSFLNRILPKK